jgi:hypothetical protein
VLQTLDIHNIKMTVVTLSGGTSISEAKLICFNLFTTLCYQNCSFNLGNISEFKYGITIL